MYIDELFHHTVLALYFGKSVMIIDARFELEINSKLNAG
jgi:hypothetical protein